MAADDLRKAVRVLKQAGVAKEEIIKIVEEEFKSSIAGIPSGENALASGASVPPDEEPPSNGGLDALSGKSFKPKK